MISANNDTFVAPPGITTSTRDQFRKAALGFIEQSAARGAKMVTLDLAATEELDASGLGLLVQMQKRAEDLELQLELVRVPAHVRHLLVMTRLEHLFTIIDDR